MSAQAKSDDHLSQVFAALADRAVALLRSAVSTSDQA
ncbi:hypothetical protein FDG2_4281 [Candidatus Protofrankia californiensis]|uniref:Uncharacterized protein n=1 Tax=Candidatus Protofrankia californiensis TaxID=1839754 RepID=A0A1C3P4Q1_9ACTN|nr:hypothetical protein FDG2_4281 [Candidatus Protofrankia californiensis]